MTDQEQTEAGVLTIVPRTLITVQIVGMSGWAKTRRHGEWTGQVQSVYGNWHTMSLFAFQIAWDMLQLGLLGDDATRAEIYEIWTVGTKPVLGDSREAGYIGRVQRYDPRPNGASFGWKGVS